MHKVQWLSVITTISLAVVGGTNAAIAYSFTRLIESNNTFSGFGAPVINNQGTVVFQGFTGGGEVIFASQNGSLIPLADTKGAFSEVVAGDLDLNDRGTVAFRAQLKTGGSGIFTSNGGTVIPVATSSNAFDLGAFPAINRQGAIAYTQGAFPGSEQVFVNSRGVTTVIPASGRSLLSGPDINDRGTVVFAASLDGTTTNFGLFRFQDGQTALVAQAGQGFSGIGAPRINGAGTIVFNGANNNGYSIYRVQDGRVEKVIATTDGVFNYVTQADLNNRGKVAFLGAIPFQGFGIYTGADPLSDKVIAPGDILEGQRVTSVSFSGRGLNNVGQIAFTAQLSDGVRAVFLANPEAIPEPSAMPGKVLAIMGLGWLRMRKARATRR